MVSARFRDIEESKTLALMSIAEEMRRAGKSIISFAVGEPDFPTPREIVEAAYQAMREGKTHYVPPAGIPELREEIAAYYRSRGADVDVAQVIITPAKLAIQLAIMTLVDRGDEVLIPDPGWVSYDPMVKIAGGIPVRYPLRAEDGYKPCPEDIRSLIGPRTRAIVLNSPSNPTGAVFSRALIREMCDVAEEFGVVVISDEVYDRIVYDVPHVSVAEVNTGSAVVIGSFSKSFAMTGWRVGYVIAPPEIYTPLLKLQQHTISCASSIAQYGALHAIRNPDLSRGMMREFRERRKVMYEEMEDVNWLEPSMPAGTFYMWARHRLQMSSEVLSSALLRNFGVVITPGSAFGPMGEGYLRFSFATSRESIVEGIERIRKGPE